MNQKMVIASVLMAAALTVISTSTMTAYAQREDQLLDRVLAQINEEIDEKIEAVEREVDPRAQPIVRWVDTNVVDNTREFVDLIAGVIGNPND
jgi:type II secretory pathway pseudopilin PulG